MDPRPTAPRPDPDELLRRAMQKHTLWLGLIRQQLWTANMAHEAEDVLQDVYLRVWLAGHRFVECNFHAWVVTILRNRVVEVLRKKANHEWRVSVERHPAALRWTTDPGVPDEDEVVDGLLRAQRWQWVEEQLEGPSPLIASERLAIQMYVKHDRNAEALSRSTGMNYKAARSAVYRGRLKLGEWVLEDAPHLLEPEVVRAT